MSEPRIVMFRGQYCLYWREDGQPKRRLLTGANGQPITSKQEAERVALDVQRIAVAAPGELVGDMATKYFADKKGRIASYENMKFAWKGIEASASHLRPEHVTREWCRSYAETARKAGRADGTIRKHLTALSAICKWTLGDASPAVIEMPPMPAARNRRLTKAEAERLIANAVAPHVKLFIILALQTAARAQAVLDLTWDRIDFDRGEIDLGVSPTRFKKRAKVPLSDASRFYLLAAKEGALTDFVIEHGGKKVASVKKGFAKAAERAKLENVSPHVLRHTAAIWMAENGTPMSEIAQFLGHTSEAVTFRTYARYSPQYLRKAAAALSLNVPQDTGVVPMHRAK